MSSRNSTTGAAPLGLRRALAVSLALACALIVATPIEAGAASALSDGHRAVDEINVERARRGLPRLGHHAGLAADARAWSAHMAATGSLTHTSNLGGETASSVPDWRRAAENIGYGASLDSVMSALWSSPGHRANMLGDFNVVGVGVSRSGGRTWVTMRFAKSPSFRAEPTVAGFVDVYASAFYATPVVWMKRNSITTGVGGSNRFAPNARVTRAELATFLWRAVGKPRTSRGVPFPDVPRSAYYYEAVAFLHARGVIGGVGNTGRFMPNAPASRGETAVFLWRLAGKPSPGGGDPFVDVPPSHFADRAVTWAYRQGITTGVGGSNRFAPGGDVTRGEGATFLYRDTR